MLLVEKCQHSQRLSYSHDYRTSIGFHIFPEGGGQQGECYVELSTVAARKATVRLLDAWGQVLLHEHERFEPGQSRLTYNIKNLKPGQYFFEVTDGFFHQVKEVQVPVG